MTTGFYIRFYDILIIFSLDLDFQILQILQRMAVFFFPARITYFCLLGFIILFSSLPTKGVSISILSEDVHLTWSLHFFGLFLRAVTPLAIEHEIRILCNYFLHAFIVYNLWLAKEIVDSIISFSEGLWFLTRSTKGRLPWTSVECL